MHFRSNLVLILILTFYEKLGQSENIPCNTRRTSAGYVCVCNATYCDTVERPTPLPRGLYLHYSTAKESPGFSVAKGKFLNSRKKLYWSSNDMFIKVDSRVQYQSFEGFGASVTGASGIMINSLPPTAQEKFFESYFGEAGLEYNIIRVPVAASDFTPRYYTYDDVPGDVDLKYFNLTEEDFTLKNLNHWVVGYIDWNIALDEQGGPSGPANLTLDAAVIVNKTTGEFYKQPIFYAIGHFSKFIPPGAKKINITVNQPIKDDGCFQFDGTEINSLGFELLPCGTPVSNSPNYSTEAPFPTWKPDPPVTEVSALATTNPDGSITIVAYNPRSEPVNLVIMDSKVGVLNQTVDAYSLNSFIYW